MDNRYEKIYDLVERSNKFVFREKQKNWIHFIVNSVMNGDCEAEIAVKAMEGLNNNLCSSLVLDIIYSTRLDITSILHIIDMIMFYYKEGPLFIRNIYANLLTNDLEMKIRNIEKENELYRLEDDNNLLLRK